MSQHYVHAHAKPLQQNFTRATFIPISAREIQIHVDMHQKECVCIPVLGFDTGGTF